MIDIIINIVLIPLMLFLGIYIGYWVCAEANGLHKKITCMPEKNIHIFDKDKKFCHCLSTGIHGERFSFPIKMQRKIDL